MRDSNRGPFKLRWVIHFKLMKEMCSRLLSGGMRKKKRVKHTATK